MARILVTGAKGQLGSEIAKIAIDYPTTDFVFVDREKMPLEDNKAILAFLNKTKPDLIISAGAYTAVDKAETEKELADSINHQAIDTMAQWCAQNTAKIIHISTDYVFDGNSKIPLRENDTTAPINWYGQTKLNGEIALGRSGADAVIIRTSWIYSEYGANFVKTMMGLMRERDTIEVVNDQIGTPTYGLDLAKAIMAIATADQWQPGVFHYSNEGKISWYQFALAIKEMGNLDCELVPVTSDKFPTLAKRPKYSLLDKSKIKKTYNLVVPAWRESLQQCLTLLNK